MSQSKLQDQESREKPRESLLSYFAYKIILGFAVMTVFTLVILFIRTEH